MEFPKMFNRGSSGEIRFHKIKVVHGLLESTIHAAHGVLNGKAIISPRVISKGKNLGKSNETTIKQQARLECRSMIRKKKDGGYKTLEELGIELDITLQRGSTSWKYKGGRYSIKNALELALPKFNTDAKGRTKPMLLHHLFIDNGQKKKSKERKITYPCLVQPKKDGVCTTIDESLTTRGGKDRAVKGGSKWDHICPQIAKAVKKLKSEYDLHGEVWLKGHTLEQIGSATKKHSTLSKKLQLWVFDVVATELTFNERLEYMHNLRKIVRDDYEIEPWVKFVPTFSCKNQEQLLQYEDRFLSEGDEGLVARNIKGVYKPDSRSKDVLKLVRFDSMELEVIDVIPMDNATEMGKFVCKYKTKDHGVRTFNVTPGKGFTHERRKELLENKNNYKGCFITIDHRGFTNKGLPRIATAKAFRELNT